MWKTYFLVKHNMKRESIAEGFLINPQSLWVAGAERLKDTVWNRKKSRIIVCVVFKQMHAKTTEHRKFCILE